MADEDKQQNLDNQESETKPEEQASSNNESQGSEVWKDLAKEAGLNPEELKSREDFVKIYKDSRKGLSEQGEKIKEYEQSIARVTPVLQAINNDPELFKRVKAALEGNTEESADKDTKQPPKDPRLDELVSDKQNQVVSEIERDFGVLNMNEEEARKARQLVGQKLKVWGFGDGKLPSVSTLKTIMEDAYTASGYSKKDQESSSSASVGFGSPRSAVISPESITADTLTPEEKQAAEKMGLSYADYAKNKREIYS